MNFCIIKTYRKEKRVWIYGVTKPVYEIIKINTQSKNDYNLIL